MVSNGKIFITAINCIDGRVQDPAQNWLLTHYKADYVDMITHPSPEKTLTQADSAILKDLRNEVEISVKAHNSHFVAIFAHNDCAANTAEYSHRLEQIKQSVSIIESWKLPIKVIGLYINERWQPQVIA